MRDIFEANGVRIIAQDDMIVRWCRAGGLPFEPATTGWMGGVMADGGVFVDVGASTGWFSCLMAARGHPVWAFEPNPRVFPRLLENLALNGLAIEARQMALSDSDGTTTLWHNPAVPLTSGASIQVPTCARPGEDQVRKARLDAVLAADLPVRLIKVDVEGHELGVLRGARGTLKRHRPHLMLEANTPAHRQALIAWLGDAYSVADADERNLLCTPCEF